jgi:1,4-alpha-glucan branching enzyme
MGIELAQEREWAESRSLDWSLLELPEHAGVQRLVRDLNATYRATPALYSRDDEPSGFSWIDANDSGNNVVSFLRFAPDGSALACIANFAGVPHYDYRIGLPCPGTWREVMNTDAGTYGGSGVGNYGAVEAASGDYQTRPASATLNLPPLGVLWLASPAPAIPGTAPARARVSDRPELRSTSPVETGRPDAVPGSTGASQTGRPAPGPGSTDTAETDSPAGR